MCVVFWYSAAKNACKMATNCPKCVNGGSCGERSCPGPIWSHKGERGFIIYNDQWEKCKYCDVWKDVFGDTLHVSSCTCVTLSCPPGVCRGLAHDVDDGDSFAVFVMQHVERDENRKEDKRAQLAELAVAVEKEEDEVKRRRLLFLVKSLE